MDKNLIIKLLTNSSIKNEDLISFISEYVLETKGKNISIKEISGIIQMIKLGYFDLNYALTQSALKENLTVLNVYNKNNQIIKTDVY